MKQKNNIDQIKSKVLNYLTANPKPDMGKMGTDLKITPRFMKKLLEEMLKTGELRIV